MKMLLAAAATAAALAAIPSAMAASAPAYAGGLSSNLLLVQFGGQVRPNCGRYASPTRDGRCREDDPPYRQVRPNCGRRASPGPDGRCYLDRPGVGPRFGRPRFGDDFDDGPPPPPRGFRYGRPRYEDPDED